MFFHGVSFISEIIYLFIYLFAIINEISNKIYSKIRVLLFFLYLNSSTFLRSFLEPYYCYEIQVIGYGQSLIVNNFFFSIFTFHFHFSINSRSTIIYIWRLQSTTFNIWRTAFPLILLDEDALQNDQLPQIPISH